jgi:hypothetical protein
MARRTKKHTRIICPPRVPRCQSSWRLPGVISDPEIPSACAVSGPCLLLTCGTPTTLLLNEYRTLTTKDLSTRCARTRLSIAVSLESVMFTVKSALKGFSELHRAGNLSKTIPGQRPVFRMQSHRPLNTTRTLMTTVSPNECQVLVKSVKCLTQSTVHWGNNRSTLSWHCKSSVLLRK